MLEYSESTGIQSKQTDTPISIADLGIFTNPEAKENGTITSSTRGSSGLPVDDVRDPIVGTPLPK